MIWRRPTLGRDATPESLAVVREEFNLNRPAYTRYAEWLGGIVVGDMGRSLSRDKTIVELIGNRLRNTIVLAVSSALIGIPLAILARGIYRSNP